MFGHIGSTRAREPIGFAGQQGQTRLSDNIQRAPSRAPVVFTICGLLLICGFPREMSAADKAQIQQAVERGKQFLLQQTKTGAHGCLACYSLIKAGVDKHHPDIEKCVQEILSRCNGAKYIPGSQHNYEAGVDAMLLEAVDREVYRPQLEKIMRFLTLKQRPYGGWNYPGQEGGIGDYGDTSISQYAILGLWATVRAGVEVPTENWERAARWLMASQVRDGGFSYHPTSPNASLGTGDGSTNTMTVAGTGSLLVIRHVLFHDTVVIEPEARPIATGKRYGFLERPPEEREKEKEKEKAKARNPAISAAAIDKALKAGVRWTGDRFPDSGSYVNYYYYGVERVAALLDVEKIGNHDWYNEGADDLLRRQTNDGSWNDSCGSMAATSLTLLFLTKATAGTINKPKPTPKVGGGLLVGGRGLPDDLDSVKMKEGEARKLQGPVDTLLADLEKSSDAKVEAVQVAVVEAVQLDRPEELIGQVDRLKKLAVDKRVEVRRTAMWALGRTGNITVAPILIGGLTDADESVAREASTALCILSRRPNGIGPTIDPADGLADDAANDARTAHLKKWGALSKKAWTDWYMKIRPYDERDDRTTLKRKP